MSSRRIFLFLTILAVIATGIVELNFYPLLSQGDHGRDLYAAQEILRGKFPYKDFWWVYGPLMPYYYAFFYKLTGGTMISFLLGKLVLKTACAAFFYLAAATMMAPSIAFLGALWFIQSQPDFFFTFNHIGGIATGLWILYLLFSYVKVPNLRDAWATLPAIFIYCLIKINFGLAALFVVAVSIPTVDLVKKTAWHTDKKKFYLSLLVGLPLAVTAVYWLLLKDLPGYAIHQCMPYFGDDQAHHFPPSITLPYYFSQHWLTLVHTGMDVARVAGQNWMGSPIGMIMMAMQIMNVLRHVVLHAATILVIVLWINGTLSTHQKKELALSLGVLALFFVVNFHEFIVSGVWYRTFWSSPFLFMFHMVLLSIALSFLPVLARRLIWIMLGVLVAFGCVVGNLSTQQQKIPQHFLNSAHAQIYVTNEPEWTATVNTVTAFLKNVLKPGELFFALPYDDIYYYLADRESPTRQLIFFDHIKIPPQQEASIIQELENKKVGYVLMSNRIASSETGLGIFGKTYCPLIAQYIAQNFVPATREGGHWQEEPGWANNHGVMIFKRK